MTLSIAFHSGHLCERGTDVAMYDYALYLKKMGAQCYIFYPTNGNNNQKVIKKFTDEFSTIRYNSLPEIEKYIIDHDIRYLYQILYGYPEYQSPNCRNLIHAVFDPRTSWGQRYATISDYLLKQFKLKIPYVPHMINLPEGITENLRSSLGIPDSAIVLGRYGGYNDFNVIDAHLAIKHILDTREDIYFLFANTDIFYSHPRIIYYPTIVDLDLKVKFINTCDYMIYARMDGETFGLSIGEFNTLGKKVICNKGFNTSHLDLLGPDSSIIYNNQFDLFDIFKSLTKPESLNLEPNGYTEMLPAIVMKKFYTVFIGSSEMSIEIKFNSSNVTKPITLVTAFFDIGRGGYQNYKRSTDYYLESFYNYLNIEAYNMIIYLDQRYYQKVMNYIITKQIKLGNKMIIPINWDFMDRNIHAWSNIPIEKQILESDEFKQINGQKVQEGNPEALYAEYNCINHAKIDFLVYTMKQGYVPNDHFLIWSDFGYHKSILQDPAIFPHKDMDPTKFDQSKMNFFLNNEVQESYNYYEVLRSSQVIFTGSLYGGPQHLLEDFQHEYHRQVNFLYSKNIADDDQHIYLLIYFQRPDLFKLTVNTFHWPRPLCLI